MNEDEAIGYYVSIGALEVVGIEDDGEFTFKVTEAAKDLAPELYDAHVSYVNENILNLFERGLINITYNEDLEAFIEITEEGRQLLVSYGIVDILDGE